MRLNNYIVTSLLSHILLFGVLVVFPPEIDTIVSVPVIDVDIVGSLGEEMTVPKTTSPVTKRGHDVKPALSVVEKSDESSTIGIKKPEALDTEMSPETVFEKGTRALNPKSFLFDKEIIEKYAQKRIKEEKDLTFDVPEFHYRGYMRMLKDKIESIWKYPEEAARRGISGDLYIRFSIRRNGRLGRVELVRTSGYNNLDEAAMKALRDAQPYWPLPEDWKGDELSITGHFIYLIGRSYMM